MNMSRMNTTYNKHLDISYLYPPNSLHSITELIIKLVCRLEMEAFKHRLSFGLNKRWSRWARSAILAPLLHQFRDSLPHYLATGVGAQSVPGDCVHWRKDLIRAAHCAWCGSCSLPLLQEEDRTATSTTFQFRLQITPTGSVTHRTPTELLPQGVPY